MRFVSGTCWCRSVRRDWNMRESIGILSNNTYQNQDAKDYRGMLKNRRRVPCSRTEWNSRRIRTCMMDSSEARIETLGNSTTYQSRKDLFPNRWDCFEGGWRSISSWQVSMTVMCVCVGWKKDWESSQKLPLRIGATSSDAAEEDFPLMESHKDLTNVRMDLHVSLWRNFGRSNGERIFFSIFFCDWLERCVWLEDVLLFFGVCVCGLKLKNWKKRRRTLSIDLRS